MEIDLERLKDETLRLIGEYNKSDSHRKVTPIDGYASDGDFIRLYWAFWSDDNRSTFMVGFMYNTLDMSFFHGEKLPINSLEGAVENFRKQLSEIPIKSNSR